MASPALARVLSMLRSTQPREGDPLDFERYRTISHGHGAEAAERRAGAPHGGGGPDGRLGRARTGPTRACACSTCTEAATSPGRSTRTARSPRASRRRRDAWGWSSTTGSRRRIRFPRRSRTASRRWLHRALRPRRRAAATPRSLFIGGDSAGGGLTLATLLETRGQVPVTAAVTLSAWTDMACTGESIVSRAPTEPFLAPHLMQPTADAYLSGWDPRDPRVVAALRRPRRGCRRS